MPGARAPAAPVQKSAQGSHRGCAETPGIPARNGFNGLFRALPGDEFVLSPSLANYGLSKPGWARKTSANLTPATGARTTRLCRTQPVFAKGLRRARSFSENGERRRRPSLGDETAGI